jgi:hypothetical protein
VSVQTYIAPARNPKTMRRRTKMNKLRGRVKCVELAWTPEVGEMIEVKYHMDPWGEAQFVGMINGQYICIDVHDNEDTYNCFKQARPIKKNHTITLEIELSEESYKALKAAV